MTFEWNGVYSSIELFYAQITILRAYKTDLFLNFEICMLKFPYACRNLGSTCIMHVRFFQKKTLIMMVVVGGGFWQTCPKGHAKQS